MHQDRLKLWEEFNTAWLSILQSQKDMTLEIAETGQPPRPPRTMMDYEFIESMGKELVSLCDNMEKHGLVDYQMGVWEEEIIASASRPEVPTKTVANFTSSSHKVSRLAGGTRSRQCRWSVDDYSEEAMSDAVTIKSHLLDNVPATMNAYALVDLHCTPGACTLAFSICFPFRCTHFLPCWCQDPLRTAPSRVCLSLIHQPFLFHHFPILSNIPKRRGKRGPRRFEEGFLSLYKYRALFGRGATEGGRSFE